MTASQLILIAGPYRSGTDGDPARIEANLRRLEAASAPLYRLGHVPMIGEWVALPTIRELGADAPDGPDVMYETASRLLEHCDAVLRLPGESAGADEDVRIARAAGLPVYTDIAQVPPAR